MALPSRPVRHNKMRPAGLEPAAYWFEARRSIRLSYGRKILSAVFKSMGRKKNVPEWT